MMMNLRLLGTAALAIVATVTAASVSQAGPTPLDAKVGPDSLKDKGVSLVFEYGAYNTHDGKPRAILKQDYGKAQLRIGLTQPALVACSISAPHAESLTVEEYLDSGSGYGKTGQVLSFGAGVKKLEFIAEPNPAGAYMYSMSTPSASWQLFSCTVETI